jgi:two-component system sensor histidine kinase/response regulator
MAESDGRARLLIVDDEEAQMKALSVTLQDEGFVTQGFTSPRQALAALRPGHFDLLLTDLSMPEMDGLDLLRAALEIDPDLVVVLMTGHGTIDTAVEAMKSGALDYILKPFKLRAILPVLERALAMRRLRRENAALARRVAERTAELEAANKELDSFSHSVSHDLRAPLRHIDGFARILAENFSGSMPPEALRHLKVITDGVDKMRQLIEDLLRFSRLGRQPLSLRPVEPVAMARQAFDEMTRENPGRRIDFRIGEAPSCMADPALLRQVFANLFSNAFKFTRGRAVAEIEFSSRREGGETVYYIRDNGTGFDMNHVDKIFGVFQRLHSAEEFEGTGVGLSLVQRIVQRHGGRIWAQAAVGQGATFSFTLPSGGA